MAKFWFKRSKNVFVPVSSEGWVVSIIVWVIGMALIYFDFFGDSLPTVIIATVVLIALLISYYAITNTKRDKTKDSLKPKDPLNILFR